ncbi:hypothetical protein ABZ599_15525 [Streptomyces misionensis]|uniref:hypothetical protein n=1 Tax=Streptomyces misionensis TaxID=67331 RepID=UPI0033D09CCC
MEDAQDRHDAVKDMIAFAAQRLEDDWNTAEAAGHGVQLSAEERTSHLAVGWTRLQAQDNVRLIYDVRFCRRYSPRAILTEIARKCRLLEIGDEDTVKILIQEWADHPRFNPDWRLDISDGHLLARLRTLRTT